MVGALWDGLAAYVDGLAEAVRNASFASGFLGPNNDLGWPRGVQEEDAPRFNLATTGEPRRAEESVEPPADPPEDARLEDGPRRHGDTAPRLERLSGTRTRFRDPS